MGLLAPFNPPLPAWRDATVWIVGASTGIGAATARLLLQAGARVVLSARSRDKLLEVARGFDAATVLPLDITDSAAVRGAWSAVRSTLGRVDLALVVAGTHQEMRAWDLREDEARKLLDVNLMGPINVTAATVEDLIRQGSGAIALVASVAGYRGLPKALIYGASKAALVNFAETLYLDLRPRGIGVYLVMPGFVKTPLTDRNDFHMPNLITAEEAAREIAQGLRDRRFEIDFPKAFTRKLRLLRLLPYRLYFPLIRKATGL